MNDLQQVEYRVVGPIPLNKMSDITLATAKLDEEYANMLLLRAASGVRIRLITCDREWGPWLQNQRRSYRLVEENNARRALERCKEKNVLSYRLSVLIPFVVAVLIPVAYLRLPIHLLIVPPMAALVITLFYLLRRINRELRLELQLKAEELERLKVEIEGQRGEIEKNMHVDQVDDFSGTVVAHAEGAFMTSAVLTKESLSHTSLYEDLNREEAFLVIDSLFREKEVKSTEVR